MPIHGTQNLLLADGTVLSVPTADGADGGVLVTNADGTVSFSSTLFEVGGDVEIDTGNIAVTSGYGIVDDSSNEQVLFTKTASAVNYLNATNAATGNGPSIQAAGSDTNIPLLLGKKGNGALIAGNLTGNARGTNAVDIQSGRGAVTQVASGTNSSAFGYGNTASGFNSSAFGHSNTASSYYSSAVGYDNTASGYFSSAFGYLNNAEGNYSSAVGYINSASGDNSSAVGYGNNAEGSEASAIGFTNTASGNNSSAIGQRCKTTIANTAEIGYWSSTTVRAGAIRMHPNGQVAMTIEDSATAPTDGGATAGSEADATLGRGMVAIQKNGTAVTLYFNNGGTIQSLSLGTLA